MPSPAKPESDVAADAAARTGDQRDLSVQIHVSPWSADRGQVRATAPVRRAASATAASRAAVTSSTVSVRSGARNRSV